EIASAKRRFEPYLPAQTAGRRRVDEQVVALRRWTSREVGKFVQRRDVATYLALAIEGRARPRLRETAPPGGLAAGVAPPIERTFAEAGGSAAEGGRARTAQRPSQPVRRILERLLQPGAERARVEPIRLGLGQHREQRIHGRFHGTLAQKLGAETVDRVDVG